MDKESACGIRKDRNVALHSDRPGTNCDRDTDAGSVGKSSMELVKTACHLKTGKYPGPGSNVDARPFSIQKAKAMRLSMHLFHTFVIRTPQQRSSYGSKVGEEDMVLLSSTRRMME